MSSPSRTKRGSAATRTSDVDVARRGRRSAPAWPSPRRRIRWPSWIPAGISTSSSTLAASVRPAPVAARAGLLDDAARARAARAGLRADELAEDAARDLLQLARARRTRAGDAIRAGLGAVAVAALAGGRDLDLDRRA